MLILVAPLPWLLPDLPDWVGNSIAGAAAIALVATVVLYVAVGRETASAMPDRGRGCGASSQGYRASQPAPHARVLVALVVVWLLDLASVLLVLHAVGIAVPPAPACSSCSRSTSRNHAAVDTRAARAVELGAVGALHVVGVPGKPAAAFAVLYPTSR